MNDMANGAGGVQAAAVPASCRIAPSALVHPNVTLGENVVIEDFCIVGYPPRGYAAGELATIIGDNTTIRTHSVIYAGCTFGSGCHIAHGVYVREHTSVGSGVSIGVNVIIEHHCTIGNNVRLQGQAGLCEHTIVEDDAWIGPRVVTTNVPHPTCDRAKDCLAGPIIRRGAIIGANVMISPDVEIGERSLIGGGSVIVKSVEDGAVMFGVPARKISSIEKVSCPYDLMEGRSPFDRTPWPSPRRIPLVDLAAQHQAHKQEMRLAVDRVILNARFISGKEVGEFEAGFAEFCGARHAIGVSNGSSALTLALMAMGIGSGDEVITASHTFVATGEAIALVGARPVFAEIEERTFAIDPDRIEALITPRTKAIMPVHLYGHPADLPRIDAIAKKHGLKIIQDAAQAHGSRIGGRPIADWGDCTCFSFFPTKNLGAYGDAGGVVTNDADLAGRIAALRDHGRDSKYSSALVGMNARLDTLQAAVLKQKLPKLPGWNKRRREIAETYRQRLAQVPVRLPEEAPDVEHVYHLFVIRTDDRDGLQRHLKDNGVDTGIHYPVPLHLQPCFAYLGHERGDFPITEAVVDTILSLPLYPELPPDDQERVAAQVEGFFAKSGTRSHAR